MLTVKALAEVVLSIVPAKEMFPDALEVKVRSAPRVAFSPKVCAPVVEIAVVLITSVPPVFVVKLVKAVVPITPERVVAPVELSVNAKAPSTVPPKVIAPLPAEIVVVAVKTVGVPESPIDIVALH